MELCSVVFQALTLQLPIQTSLSVALELPVSLSSGEKCLKIQENKHSPGETVLYGGFVNSAVESPKVGGGWHGHERIWAKGGANS